jgi:putative serine protease PepD
MPIGSSADLRTGDEITALGFPAIASLDLDDPLARALTVTRGVVSTFKRDAVIGSNRGSIDSDIRIGSGNSGGASINDDGELVGVNTAVITQQTTDEGGAFTGGSALIRPIDLAEEVLSIAGDGGDPAYVSPFLESMPTAPTELPAGAEVVSAGWTGDGQGQCTGSSTVEAPQEYAVPDVGQVIFAEFAVTGIEDGTSVTFDFYDLTGDTVLVSLQEVWGFGPGEICIFVPFEVPEGANGANGAFTVGDQVLAENPVVFVQP